MTLHPPHDLLWWYCAVFSFILGINWGSFFNVCIYRVPVKKSVVRPGSHCYHCGSFLKWYDNIPLLSYLLLRGNCRSCGTHFSMRYFWVELLTGCLFVGLFIQFGLGWALPFHMIFAGMLVIGVFTDIDHFILPDSVTLGGIVFGLAVAALLGRQAVISDDFQLSRDVYHSFVAPNELGEHGVPARWMVFAWSVACAAFGYAMLWAIGWLGRMIFHKEAMGGGDVKLFGFLGAYLGAIDCVWILFLSALLGSALGLSLILTHKLLHKDEYEELALGTGETVKLPWRTVDFRSRAGRQSDAGITSIEAPQDAEASDQQGSAAPEPIHLRIARRTSRQLHHFPYGPYIAVAALIVLFCHEWLDRATREYLMIPFK